MGVAVRRAVNPCSSIKPRTPCSECISAPKSPANLINLVLVEEVDTACVAPREQLSSLEATDGRQTAIQSFRHSGASEHKGTIADPGTGMPQVLPASHRLRRL